MDRTEYNTEGSARDLNVFSLSLIGKLLRILRIYNLISFLFIWLQTRLRILKRQRKITFQLKLISFDLNLQT